MRLPALVWTLIPGLVHAQQYELQSYFSGATFLDNFDFYTSWDPTYGYVHYVDRVAGEQNGMISYTSNTTRWGVEATQVLDPSANLGRLSLRLQSKQRWTHGLFILDLAHMPHNSCGVWPAWWMLGNGLWPSQGEIDIVEFTNNGPSNLMTMHTLPGCSIAGSGMTGQLDYADCNEAGASTGCAIQAKEVHGSGAEFNAIGGGVYAMEWTARWVRVWFFPRHAIPASLASAEDSTAPDTSTFGVPVANFEGNCNLDSYLSDHQMIFNVDLCGTSAGGNFGKQGCPLTDPSNAWSSCVQYVALTPQAFTEVYWEVNYLKVFQDVSGWVPPSSALSSVVPAASSSVADTVSSNAQGRPTTPTMSLAATTPTDISGSFSATSSALSVISSFSTASEASFSSSMSTASSLLPSSPSTESPFVSSTSTASTSLLSPPPVSPLVSTPSPATLPPSASAPAPAVVTFVTVVQTITINPTISVAQEHNDRPQHFRRDKTLTQAPEPSAPTTPSLSSTPGINKNGNCSFTITDLPTPTSSDVACTFTKLDVHHGQVYTNRITFSTTLPWSTGLTLRTF